MLRDRQIVEDLIKDERFLNLSLTFCSVESSPQLKSTLMDIQREEQDIHSRLFQFAQRQGWYPTLWGDFGYQPQPAGVTAGYGAAQQPWITPQQNWQQQPAWQQQNYVQPGYAAAGFSPNVQSPLLAGQTPTYGQPQAFGQTQGQTAGIQAAGRQYGPY